MLVLVALALTVAAIAFRLHTRTRPGPPEPTTTWEIIIPRDARFTTSQAAAWFTALGPMLIDSAFAPSVELRGLRHELRLILTAPTSWATALDAQLAAWFPGARLESLAETHSSGIRVSQSLVPEKLELLPIRIVADGETDPLSAIVGSLTHAGIASGLRLTWRTVPSDWKAWSRDALAAFKKGAATGSRQWPRWARLIYDLAAHAVRRSAGASPPSLPTLTAAADKARATVFEGSVEIWAAGSTEQASNQVRILAAQMTAGFRDPFGNQLKSIVGNHSGSFVPQWRVLSVEELASLFHLPHSEHPLVPTEPGRRIVPRSVLVHSNREDGATTWLGEALTNQGPKPFGLSIPERRQHLYVVGKTGTGKSTFLANIARQDLENGSGLALIDPHGDLAERVLSLVPQSRYGDVVYFNAADTDYPIAYNPFHCRTPAERPLVASGVVGVFKKLYGDSWGPRLEHFLRNSVLAMLEAPDPSLLALPRLLTDKPFRQHLLTQVRDPLLRSFFLEEYERYDPRWRAEAISPILNKVGQFLSSPVVRHLVAQRVAGLDLRVLMDRQGIFIANLASGRIGEDNCDLLGGLLVAGFQLAAMSRADRPEAERPDFYLLVDEFQHFANDAFIGILSEARKYRLGLTLSHQYLDQVPSEISEAVFGNVGSLAAFRVGASDVPRLAQEFAPVFDGQDLVHLSNYHFSVRLAQHTGVAPAFSARTVLPTESRAALGDLIRHSRERWSRPREQVEREVRETWTGSGMPTS